MTLFSNFSVFTDCRKNPLSLLIFCSAHILILVNESGESLTSLSLSFNRDPLQVIVQVCILLQFSLVRYYRVTGLVSAIEVRNSHYQIL